MSRETGKQRASGIPLDYFRHRNPLDRGKLILAGIAAVGVVGWLVVGSFSGPRMETWYSPGPVSAAHAMWENDCQKCHVSFTPIAGDAAAAALLSDRTAIDANCRTCHQEIGGKASPVGHHASKDPAMLVCSSCHHEHRGRGESLSRMADASCTSCHAQISEHRAAASLLAVQNVSRFDAEHHPQFRSIQLDPRQLKFSAATHHLHLTAGMAVDAKHQPVMTVGMLSAGDKSKYMLPGQTDGSLVQLSCGSCHQANGTEVGSGTGRLRRPVPPDRAAGAYMAPIVFENQCRACHPLTIDPGRDATVPHRLPPDQAAVEVRRYWAERYLRDHPEQSERVRPLPGQSKEPEDPTVGQWINEKVASSMRHLRTVCAKCHEYGSGATNELLAANQPPAVLPVYVPRTWFEHAKFDHAAHRAVADCRTCHAGAYSPESSGPSVAASAPMIPGRDTCHQCHSPLQESSDRAHGGARFDCAECHRFHSQDEPAVP